MPKTEPRQELKQLLTLQKLERDEDLRLYKQKMVARSLKERVAEGMTWYPVVLQKQYIGTGEYVHIEIERTKAKGHNHLFASGKSVGLFSNTGAESESAMTNGVIKWVRKDSMQIALNADELPEWIDDGKLGLNLLFDDATYEEMTRAVQEVIGAEGNRLAELREILLGSEAASFAEQEPFSSPRLNEVQNQAMQQALAAEDLMIIHGPPGTGKTTTLVETITQTVKREKKVLVCAPSNAAVDLLAQRLHTAGLFVIRFGHPARITEELSALTIDSRIAQHPSYADLRAVRKKSEEFKRMARKYKRNFGRAEREQRKALFQESRKLREEADQLEHYITEDLYAKAQVMACTLIGAAGKMLQGMDFETVFIDEAAQALEGGCWVPIQKAKRVILAGDHLQLPPTIKSREAAKGGLEVTLFEKAIKRNAADVMLEVQYRMHEAIMTFSGTYFYKGRLRADDSVRKRGFPGDEEPIVFIDTAGCGYEEQQDKETLSSQNQEEARLVIRHLKQVLAQQGQDYFEEQDLNIAIISPYKAQVRLFNELIAAEEELVHLDKRLRVNTIDSFQGQEKDLIYISLVRSNQEGEIGFLKDTRRMNVAITRAKRKLVVVGDSATVGSHPFYSSYLDYVQDKGAYHSAFEYMDF